MPTPVSNRPAAPVPTTPRPSEHRVVSGDTMSKIAQRMGVSTQALVDANKARYPTLATNAGNIQVGWTLSIPGGTGAPAPAPNPPAPPAAGWAPRSNNDVLIVGMNEGAKHEADSLRARGNKVTLVSDARVNDTITTRDATGRSVTHDLTSAAGATAFALTLGLPAEQTQKIATIIQGSGADSRDELAQLAQVWSQAEKGGQIPSRFMLSGHNVGSGVWGDDNGMIRFETLSKLADAMPRAARSVEDVHLAACYSGGEPLMEKYRGMFPNAKTIWAYSGSAPGSYSGATTHHARWDTATRGDKDSLDRAIAANTRKGENVAVWSQKLGYVDGQPQRPLSEVRGGLTRAEPQFTRHFSGEAPVTDTQSGPLREYYNQLQRVLQHRELPAAERPALEAKRDTTIRLIYFSKTVAPKFQEAHAASIRGGFEAVGLPPPNFGTLSRADAMAQVTAFEQKLSGMNPRPAAAQQLLPLLTEGLRDLTPARIPEAWV